MRFLPFCAAASCMLVLVSSDAAFAQTKNGYQELKDVLYKVCENNPELQAAREKFRETQELYPQARAGWLPSVNAEASVYHSDIENSNFNSVADGSTTKDLTLSLDQPIWRGGRTFAETDSANAQIQAGKATLLQVHQDIFLRTLGVYMDVLRDRELLDLRRQNEDVLLDELKAAWERKKLGDITVTDVQQAKARLARAKSERVEAQSNLQTSAAKFEEMAGIEPPKKLLMPYVNFHFPSTLKEMQKQAEQRNPELWSVQYEHSAAEHDVRATSRELLPQVSAFASLDKQYDPQPGIVDDSRTKTIGIRATMALYEGGATRSRIRKSKHTAKRKEYEIEETRRKIKQQVRTNWNSYRAAQKTTEIRKDEIDSAQQALKGVREESRLGQRTVIDILDADQDVIDAKIALARARHDEIIAQFALARAMGFLTPHVLGMSKPQTTN